jgi:hypothetical protein
MLGVMLPKLQTFINFVLRIEVELQRFFQSRNKQIPTHNEIHELL